MPEKLTPTEISEKQARNLKGATEDIRRGIERVTEAPGAKAAAAQEKMRAKLLESIDDGTWGERVASVTLVEWKEKAINKGVGRIAAGIEAAKPKIVEFHTQRQAHQQGIDGELELMPSVTLEDGIARATHQMRRMSEFKFRR